MPTFPHIQQSSAWNVTSCRAFQIQIALCNTSKISIYYISNICPAGAKVKPWDGRSPLSIAAAILYIITQMKITGRDAITMQDIVLVTQVAEVTVRAAYK